MLDLFILAMVLLTILVIAIKYGGKYKKQKTDSNETPIIISYDDISSDKFALLEEEFNALRDKNAARERSRQKIQKIPMGLVAVEVFPETGSTEAVENIFQGNMETLHPPITTSSTSIPVSTPTPNSETSFTDGFLDETETVFTAPISNPNPSIHANDQRDSILNHYGVRYLYHITHIDNLESILITGLKSHNEAWGSGLASNNMSIIGMNDRRKKIDPLYRRRLQDYASLYFTPKNFILYHKKHLQDHIVIIGFDRRILYQEGVIFTDGNAADNSTKYYHRIEDLSKLDWKTITHISWNSQHDARRIRCAEILVYPAVHPQYARVIYCHNEAVKMRCDNMLNTKGIPVKSEINRSIYF